MKNLIIILLMVIYGNMLFDTIFSFYIKNIYIMAIVKKTATKKMIPLEKEELLELIFLDLIQGFSRYQIMLKLDRDAYPNHKTSKLSKACKYQYIQEAMLNCEAELKETKDKQRNLFYQQILGVFYDAEQANDRQNALKALDMLGKVAGLYAKEEKDVNISGNISATISFGLEEEDGDKSEI